MSKFPREKESWQSEREPFRASCVGLLAERAILF